MNNLISKQFLTGRLSSLIFSVKRSIIIPSDYDLGKQMKFLNDNKQFKQTIELFDKYKKNNIQSCSSFIITQVIKACTYTKDLQRGSNIHNLISSRVKNDSYIASSLIYLYTQCSDLTRAQSIFDETSEKSLSIYASMIKGYIINNQANKAVALFHQVKNPDEVIIIILFNACAKLETVEALDIVKKVVKDIPTSYFSNLRLLTSLLDALMRCGDSIYAQLLFDSSPKKIKAMYGAMMNGYNKQNNPFKTLQLFNQMRIDGFDGDIIIYQCLIKALSQIGDYETTQSYVKQIPHSCLLDNQIQNGLIDMWGKNGDVDRAKQIFEKIDQPDQVGYTAMVNCYGLNGMGVQAIELYRQIPTEYLNEVTNICILNACSHSGLVTEARSIFQTIKIKTENIYCTMIDCFSRASFFEEAQDLINDFERYHSPMLPMYMALLSGARNVNNTFLSQTVYDRMKKLFPQMTNPLRSAAVLLANVYASSGDIDKALSIRIQLNKSGAKRKVGVTWTVVDGEFFQFRAHDQSHPQSTEIYAEVEKISKELIEHGHQYDSSWIIRPLEENETIESVLCGHSEKLAIAWNFVAHPDTSRIQVTKNLRVCGDCHRATKLIATIRQCDIIVRDANRIHHFYKNGQCSCNDYF